MSRKETKRLAARPTLDDWIDRTRRRPGARTKRATLVALDATLITLDSRLARPNGPRCPIEVVTA